MTESFFKDQIRRLRVRFGDKNFDNEFVLLLWREVQGMSEHALQRYVDVLIGSRSANKPPLLSEFREARLAEEKRRFEYELAGATQSMQRRSPEEMRRHLRLVLAKEYGGVESAGDALEIAQTKARIANANDDDGGAA